MFTLNIRVSAPVNFFYGIIYKWLINVGPFYWDSFLDVYLFRNITDSAIRLKDHLFVIDNPKVLVVIKNWIFIYQGISAS
ncbi:hypothetical protein BFW25_20170 [Aeromonas caviae]|nr:hypothetical protein BFW25_20170 [Aeromonas caviae]